MKRNLFLLYGVACYLLFIVTLAYTVAFVNAILISRNVDATPSTSFARALPIDLALLLVFALQHSVMARVGFKKWWKRFVPEPIERSTYVLLTCICLIALFWFWEPIGGIIWHVTSPFFAATLKAISLGGFIVAGVSTFLINHFELFGLRQVWSYYKGTQISDTAFKTPSLYKIVRHPLYLGFLIAFWSAPTMTAAHFVFAFVTTAYILVAIRFEERDLTHAFGEQYIAYQKRAPMIIPWIYSRRQASKRKKGME